jgi:hypothetical protein
MSSSFPGWTWDPVQKEYYYVNNQEYVYENGRRIPIHTAPADARNSRRSVVN